MLESQVVLAEATQPRALWTITRLLSCLPSAPSLPVILVSRLSLYSVNTPMAGNAIVLLGEEGALLVADNSQPTRRPPAATAAVLFHWSVGIPAH